MPESGHQLCEHFVVVIRLGVKSNSLNDALVSDYYVRIGSSVCKTSSTSANHQSGPPRAALDAHSASNLFDGGGLANLDVADPESVCLKRNKY